MQDKTVFLWIVPLLVVVIGGLLFGGCMRGGETTPTDAPDSSGAAELRFDSFDGGGMEYTVTVDDPSVVSYDSRRDYGKQNHEEIDGAAYDFVLTFRGLKPGETTVTVSGESPIMEPTRSVYTVLVDDALRVTLTQRETEPDVEAIRPTPTLVAAVGDKVFYAQIADNVAAEAFRDRLSKEAIEVEVHDNGGVEMVGALPWALPVADGEITIEPGDILLSRGDQIGFCCGEDIRTLTRLATIHNVTREELLAAFGDTDATVSLWVEWSE